MSKKMFDVAIFNPPYQKDTKDTSDIPVYNIFIDASIGVSENTEVISPARFLFNAGKTPKKWNEKMLNDPHFKVLNYEPVSGKVFPNTDIKGGIAITFYSHHSDFGAIKSFTAFSDLNSILHKTISNKDFKSIMPIMHTQNKFNLDILYNARPDLKTRIGSGGREKRLTTSIFKLDIFHNTKGKNDIEIIGLMNGKRESKFINKSFIEESCDLNKYKVLVPAGNGSGALGEVLSTPMIGTPMIGYTQTFIAFGAFDNEKDANNCLKYIKTKYSRTLLGVLKITQHNHIPTWKYVPLQDFTDRSDIDWSKSIPEIDQQLYRKYGLSDEEIDFIETHVKEME